MAIKASLIGKRHRDLKPHYGVCFLEHSHLMCQMPNIWHLAHQTPKTPLMKCSKCYNIWYIWTVLFHLWNGADENAKKKIIFYSFSLSSFVTFFLLSFPLWLSFFSLFLFSSFFLRLSFHLLSLSLPFVFSLSYCDIKEHYY